MNTNPKLLSDDILMIADGLQSAITDDRNSSYKQKARDGVAYYKGEHAVLKNRIFYLDKNGVLKEDRFASNIKIPHQFLTEMVDQKVNFLLSNPVTVDVATDDEWAEDFLSKLAEYYDDDFQVLLQEMVEGASQKGAEYLFPRMTEADKLRFEVADSLCLFSAYDDKGVERRKVRYYDKDIYAPNGTKKTISKAEVWDDKQVWFFVSIDGKGYRPDETQLLNPRPHVVAINPATEDLGAIEYGFIPFCELKNNRYAQTDLEPIKALIDDYDLMDAFMSNNLQDFAEAIYVVSGFQGDDLDKLRQNIKARKVVSTGTGGGMDIKTVQIPVEGRKVKMEIDKENIYKFGMGFDSAQVGDGNITNVVIRARYSLLGLKAGKTEKRFRAMLKWINERVVWDINRRYGTNYNPEMVKFEITKEMIVNEMDNIQNAQTEATTRQIIIGSILTASTVIDDDSVLRLICEQFDLDWEQVKTAKETELYTRGLADNTDPEIDAEGAVM
jgi:SPP1 family phage portal protein